MPRTLAATLVMLASTMLTEPASADPRLQLLIDGAMQECTLGRLAHERAERVAHFAHGQALGEQAVEADGRSAEGHFALFCNLGEQMRIDGEHSMSSIFGFRRMMKELNRTLELAPDHLDALSARGTLLVRLPVLLGGDKAEGERLLRQVIEREPTAVNARLSLAKSYCEGGRHQEAVAIAVTALDLAQSQHRTDFIPEARQVLSQLRAQAAKAN